jgi:hypothetical protein
MYPQLGRDRQERRVASQRAVCRIRGLVKSHCPCLVAQRLPMCPLRTNKGALGNYACPEAEPRKVLQNL